MSQQLAMELLLIEDNPGDVMLTKAAFKKSRIPTRVHPVETAEQALNVLRKLGDYADAITPDLILLDLNLPKMSGTELLEILKADETFRAIPVVILSSSEDERDIQDSYGRYANSYITKPISARAFVQVVESIEGFWFEIAQLPK